MSVCAAPHHQHDGIDAAVTGHEAHDDARDLLNDTVPMSQSAAGADAFRGAPAPSVTADGARRMEAASPRAPPAPAAPRMA
eukprot:gene39189-13683_t